MDANAIVKTAIRNTLASPKQGAAYFARPRGSYIAALRGLGDKGHEGAVAAALLASHTFVEVTDEARLSGVSFHACRYFRADLIPGGEAFEACALLSELSEAELEHVRVRAGHHGALELVADSLPMRPTNVLHIVIGTAADPSQEPGEDAVVFTWYPGRLTATVNIAAATVKLG